MGIGRQTARFLTALLVVVATPATAQVVVTAQDGPCAETTFEVVLLNSKLQPPSRLRLDLTQRTTKAKTTATAEADGEGHYTRRHSGCCSQIMTSACSAARRRKSCWVTTA